MSTLLAKAQPATSPAGPTESITWAQLFAALGFLGSVAIGVTVAAYFLGAFRRRTVQGPPRLEPRQPLWPLPVALVAGLFGLFVGGGLVALALGAADGVDLLDESVRPPTAVEADPDQASVQVIKMQISAASSVCATAGALLALGVARMAGWRGGIGMSLRKLPRGIWQGALALLLVIPWMLTAGMLLQIVRKVLGYPPDAMHEIIRAIRDHPEPDLIAWGLITAVIVAPLAEEVLFRGFLQTSLVHGTARLFGGKAQPPAPEAPPSDATPPFAQIAPLLVAGAAPERQLAYMPAPVPAAPVRHPPAARFRWIGIVLTSMVFAALHEPWSIPLILLLALSLGYLYERTGNLWTTITVHFGFNAFNLLVVLPFII